MGEREIPDHPLTNQAISDCLNEAMDIQGLERLLGRVESGAVRVIACDLTQPSPLALEALSGGEREELLSLIQTSREHTKSDDMVAVQTVERVRALYEKAKVFAKADKLVEKYRARAEAIADEVEPLELRELLYYLVDSVLERQAPCDEPKTFMVELGRTQN